MKLILRSLLGLAAGLAIALPAFAEVSSQETQAKTLNYCQDFSSAASWAQGYGSDYANCRIARKNAESAALHYCYAAGHSSCELRNSHITYSSYNRCDAEASAMSAYQSVCRPERTFVRTAWAQNYGSENENCRIAKRVAGDNARSDCQRAGYRQCRIVNDHILRTNGQQYCEAATVVKGSY